MTRKQPRHRFPWLRETPPFIPSSHFTSLPSLVHHRHRRYSDESSSLFLSFSPPLSSSLLSFHPRLYRPIQYRRSDNVVVAPSGSLPLCKNSIREANAPAPDSPRRRDSPPSRERPEESRLSRKERPFATRNDVLGRNVRRRSVSRTRRISQRPLGS